MKITAIFQNPLNYFSKKKDNSLLVSRAKQYSGEYSKFLPYSRFYEFYHQTPSVKRNLNSLHRRWMGSSIEVTSNDKTFDKLWTMWSDTVNFIPKLKEFALDTLITGTGMFEKQFYNNTFANIEHIPTKTLYRIFRDEFANILSIWQMIDGDTKELAPKNMILFTINNPERDAVGKSAMYALAVPQKVAGKVDELGNPINPDRYLPSILDVKTRLNYAHMEIAEKQAKTRAFVSIKGMKDTTRQKQIEADLENEASSKYVTVTDGDVDIKTIEFKSSVNSEKFLNDMDTQISQGTGFPGNVIDKGGEMGYASSQTPMQDLSSSIEDMQNDLSEVVNDEIFRTLCEQWKLDYDEVQPKLVFKTFVEKVTFENLIKIPSDAPLAPEELRAAYKEFIPGMDDKLWKEHAAKLEEQKSEELKAKGGPENKNPRPDVEKNAPKPDKTIEHLMKNPKDFENYLGQVIKEKTQEAFSTYFALPPVNGQPFTTKTPDITNPDILKDVKEMLSEIKDGIANLQEDEEKSEESATPHEFVAGKNPKNCKICGVSPDDLIHEIPKTKKPSKPRSKK